MADKIVMLALSPTMEIGTIAVWDKKEGDAIKSGDVLCEVETDKATMDYESNVEGTLLKIVAGEGARVNVGELIAIAGKPGEEISTCHYVGGSFVFIRRKVLKKHTPLDWTVSPVKAMCLSARRKDGWKIGYLTNVYCQHTGTISVRKSIDMSDELEKVLPINKDTLEPPKQYKG